MTFVSPSPPAMASGKGPSRWNALMAIAIVGGLFVTLALISWRRWPDLVVDFGSQLYIPWRISKGAVLYSDVAYLGGGPLSQHYHALLFAIFGASFLTVVLSNMALLAVLLTVMYRRFYRCSDQLAAVTTCVAVLPVFAFAQYTFMDNFNYITPYCAEAVHGLVLSVLAVALLARWIETEQPRMAAAAGLCGGLVFLTKPDIFAALALTFVAAGVIFWRAKRNGRLLGRSLALMAGVAMIPLAGFFLWFLRVENFQQSLRSVFAAWTPLLTSRVLENKYYQACMGLDEPLVFLRRTAIHFVVLAAVAGVCAVVCLRNIPRLLRWILPIAAGAVLVWASWNFEWFWCGCCLPLVCLTLLALLLRRLAAGRSEPGWVFALLWAFWSLVLLAKLGVFWRIFHYGFVLAMPAFVSGIYLLLWVAPQALDRRGVRPQVFRALLTLILLAGLAQLTQASLVSRSNKTVPVGSGADTFLRYNSRSGSPRDSEVAAALQWIQANVPSGATMTVLPQGVMLNYLSRHSNPCGYLDWNPFEITAHGQTQMTHAFIRHSPDYVVWMCIDYSQHGQSLFGADKRFGQDLMEWIDAHYEPVWQSSPDWLTDAFGIKILKRITEATPNNFLFRFNLGEFCLKAHREADAISNLLAAVREKPDFAPARNELGAVLLRQMSYDDAISQLQEAVRLKPDFAAARDNLGMALEGKGRFDEAINQLQEAIRQQPDYAEARNNLGVAFNAKGRADEAIAQFQEAVRLTPDFARARNNLGTALEGKGRIDEAISQFQDAIRQQPDFAEAHNNLGVALNAKGRVDEAIAQFRDAIRLNPDSPEACNNLGMALQGKRQFDEALAQFQEAIRLKPDYAEAHNSLGVALAMKGRMVEAVAQFQEAIRLKPDYAGARDNLARALRFKSTSATR